MGANSGKIALITGASRGLGYAMARQLAFTGATVIALARTVGGLEELDDDIKRDAREHTTGGSTVLVPCDLRALDTLDSLALSLAERFGKLDYFISNAGVLGGLMPVHNIPNKNWQEAFTVNVEAPFRLLRAVHPLLLNSDAGKVLSITSDKGTEPYWGLFTATKAAWDNLLHSYAQEVAHTSIRVYFADPGEIPTALHKDAFPGQVIPRDEAQIVIKQAAERCLRKIA